MIIPVRCYTCGKVVGSLYEEYMKKVEAGERADEVLDGLGASRYCCRRMIISHIDVIDDVLPYG